MSTLNVAWNDAAVASIGCVATGTAFNSGVRVTTTGSSPEFDLWFTGADTVTLTAAYLASTSDPLITLRDTTGAVLATAPTTGRVATTFTPFNAIQFTALNPLTTYWLRMVYVGGGSDIIQSDQLIQLSGAATTPVVSYPGVYGPVLTYGAGIGGTDVSTHTGLEGYQQITTTFGYPSLKDHQIAMGIFRFVGNATDVWLKCYGSTGNIHLNLLLADGSSGTPIGTGFTLALSNSGTIDPWVKIATGISAGSNYIYEFTTSAGSQAIIFGVMLVGGTGIDTSVSSATLTRSLKLADIGDSRVCGINGTTSNSNVCSLALLGQALNKQILNAGVPAESLQTLSASSTRYQDITGNPSGVPSAGVLIDAGINDIKSGSPPSATTLSGYMITLINKIRAVGGGWATVPIYVCAIKPYNLMTYAQIEVFNSGANGYKFAVVAAFNAGTAAGQSPSPDPNVYYIDESAWELAGHSYVTGGSFVTTLFDDGLHLNSIYATGNPAASTPASGFYAEYVFLNAIFGGGGSGPIPQTSLEGGFQTMNGGING